MTSTIDVKGVDVVLLDIEGTICSISFVKDVLFPYALQALPSVLRERWNESDFIPYRDAFPKEARGSPEAFESHVRDLTRRDVKIAYLKNLQGYLWESGYKSNAYASPFFPDVVPRLKKWQSPSSSPPSSSSSSLASMNIAVYSSGSVFAQKLLFGHVEQSAASTSIPTSSATTTATTTPTLKNTTKSPDTDENAKHETIDLTGLVTAWFDTTNAGPKTEAESYRKIATRLPPSTQTSRNQDRNRDRNEKGATTGVHPNTVIFLSDNVNEIRAALEAGMQAVVVDREGNAPLSEEDREEFVVVGGLDEINIVVGF